MHAIALTARSLLSMIAVLCLAAPVPAVTTEDFQLRSGADVVALCSAPSGDPLYVAAVHMCHGFGAGVFQTIQAMTTHEKLEPLICPPKPTPSRNEGVKLFLEWAKRNPQHLSDPPADVVGRFLVAQFPCRK